MSIEIIVAIIAVSGVIISGLLSFFISRKTIRNEQKKVNFEIEATFYNMISSNRIEAYKILYELISEFLKDEKTGGLIPSRKPINRQSILNFIEKYDVLNSKYGVLYSGATGGCSVRMRKKSYEILSKTNEENFVEIFDLNYRKDFIRLIEDLESALKADIGIYTLKHKNFDNSFIIRTYDELIKVNEERRKMRKQSAQSSSQPHQS